MDAMEFFRRSEGQWQSQRTTHHLPFRRAESGSSSIRVKSLDADDPQVIKICEMHDFDPATTIGGAHVTWNGSMDWDKEDEDHEGSTVFALVPDEGNPKAGSLLREQGYAEIAPVVGRYLIDEEEGLVLTTEYETMSSTERFWFMGSDLRLRSSTVKRFGGLSTSSFCAETRVVDRSVDRVVDKAAAPESEKSWDETALYSSLGW